MAVGPSAAEANTFLDGLDGTFAQLHIGDPGASGTANTATETTRQLMSLGTSSGGSVTNDTALTWTSIAGSQDASHISLWSASTAGTFRFSGTITASAYTAGNTFEIAIGGATLSLSPVAA